MKTLHFLICCALLVSMQGCGYKDDLPVVDLHLPSDLEATLWATSPMLFNPTNMDVDIKGRIWVTEAVNYRNYNNDSTRSLHHELGDRVIILEDEDHDGKADTAKIFVQDKDLVSPLGIAVIGNKVVVSCSPHLIIYTDDNGDDVPDKKEIFLTGFGGLDHDHSLHAVVVGPDGKWYFNTGNAGPHIVKDKAGWMLRSGSIYTGGSPYNKQNSGNMKSDDGRVWVGGLSLRIDSDGKGLKVMGHNFRNSYETAVDSYGNLWQNDNDDQVVACRTSWLMEGGDAGYFSKDGTRYWQADQRPWQDIFTAHWHQDDPGVMPAGDRSGAGAPTGIVRYEGDVLGNAYRGMVLSADAGRNMIFAYNPKVQQSGYDIGKRTNFLTSLSADNPRYVWNDTAQNKDNDKWFRPSDVVVGTDGTLYVADWYDPVVGGHQMKDSLGYGRIYRITPKGKNPLSPPIDLNSMDGLIAALMSPAIHVRAVAFESLKQKNESAVDPVSALLKNENPFEQARAVWLLANLGERGRDQVKRLLDHSDPLLRATALRALRQVEKEIIPYAEKLATDSSDFVRREVAIALRDVPFEKTKPVLMKLAARYKGTDKWYLESLASGCAGNEEEFYQSLVENKIVIKDPKQWDNRTSSFAWRFHPQQITADLNSRASDSSIATADRSMAITALAFINTPRAVTAMLDLSKSSIKQVAEEATYWLAFRQSNEWYSLTKWDESGIDIVNEQKMIEMKVKLSKVLNDDLPLDEKKWNASDMASDEVGAQMLMGMVAEDKIPHELYPAIEAVIFKNPAMAIRIQASSYFAKPGVSKSYSIPNIVSLQPNPSEGRVIFQKNCTTCHRIKTEGNDIGPDLSLIGRKFDQEGLVDAIVNPSAGIVFGYEPWLITTKRGESFYGFLIADGAQTIVISDMTGRKNIIQTSKVSTRRKQEHGMMPEPSSFGLSEQEICDLSGYLLSLR